MQEPIIVERLIKIQKAINELLEEKKKGKIVIFIDDGIIKGIQTVEDDFYI